eukprot:8858-Heterococcus_DN1.PRE.1
MTPEAIRACLQTASVSMVTAMTVAVVYAIAVSKGSVLPETISAALAVPELVSTTSGVCGGSSGAIALLYLTCDDTACVGAYAVYSVSVR